jgi:CBS domain-containing protein
MRVQDLMQSDMTTAVADQLVADAIVTLADAGVHGLPVVDPQSRKLVGVVSTTDILEAISEHQGSQTQRFLETTTVGEIMTRVVTTISPDAAATEAAQMMLYRDIHRLFVELDGKLVGVISQSDIVRAVGTARI